MLSGASIKAYTSSEPVERVIELLAKFQVAGK
ncbi:MAG: hypothetical protein ACJAQW_002314, partial [Paracoccaceae bacterium]